MAAFGQLQRLLSAALASVASKVSIFNGGASDTGDGLDPSTPSTGEAVHKVFAIYELTELILKDLPKDDLMNSAQVCRTWRDIIFQIPHILEKKFVYELLLAASKSEDTAEKIFSSATFRARVLSERLPVCTRLQRPIQTHRSRILSFNVPGGSYWLFKVSLPEGQIVVLRTPNTNSHLLIPNDVNVRPRQLELTGSLRRPLVHNSTYRRAPEWYGMDGKLVHRIEDKEMHCRGETLTLRAYAETYFPTIGRSKA